MWKLLEEAFGLPEEDKFEKTKRAYENYVRPKGCSISSYIVTLKRLKKEYLVEDPGTKISEKAWCQALLDKSGLKRDLINDIWFNAGSKYDFTELEKVMRRRCKDAHQKDPTRESRTHNRPRHRSRSAHARPYKGKTRGVHYEDQEVDSQESNHEEEDSEEGDSEHGSENVQESEEEISEDNPEDANETLAAGQEGDEEILDSDEGDEKIESSEEEQQDLKEAWEAGWRAKSKTADQRKARGFSRNRSATRPSRGTSRPESRPRSNGHGKGHSQPHEDPRKVARDRNKEKNGHWQTDNNMRASKYPDKPRQKSFRKNSRQPSRSRDTSRKPKGVSLVSAAPANTPDGQNVSAKEVNAVSTKPEPYMFKDNKEKMSYMTTMMNAQTNGTPKNVGFPAEEVLASDVPTKAQPPEVRKALVKAATSRCTETIKPNAEAKGAKEVVGPRAKAETQALDECSKMWRTRPSRQKPLPENAPAPVSSPKSQTTPKE